jgi:hypothetical protein
MQTADLRATGDELSGVQKIRGEFTTLTDDAQTRHARLRGLAESLLPQYGTNWHRHALVTTQASAMARILYYNELYKKIVDVPGVICEFGVQWGATLTQLVNLRSIHEPFNLSRIIYGFDTFEGFASTSPNDGGWSSQGDYASTDGYEHTLDEILALHESFSPMPHVKKYELIKGDAAVTSAQWLEENPHAVISMAIFDMDLYEPTRDVLRNILPRLVRGSLLVFDELNCRQFPGETIALDEVIGLNRLRLHRSPLQPYCAWAVFGD